MKENEQEQEQKGTENEFPFEQEEVKTSDKPTRAELELLTNKELAKLAEPKQDRYSFNSLKGRSKPFLIDIILGVNDDVPDVNKSKAKAPHSSSESENMLNVGLNLLQSFKMQREGQEAILNPIATEMFKNSAVAKVDEARADGVLKTDKFNNVILGISATALVVDGLIGFNNVPTLFQKVRAKFSKKA
ncbi:MAG: hypothetical protein C0626_02060 [Arcobacter sp.]|uniref:hypothetical protein n=1 Tax=uncultured Arcobacter sp. TaxID=165434 RepID=UPI000CAA960F|nr:hypothetical protein [uncultured Arcobacter sp.]PLY11376.1 MAG: hypothetical protein C0626_02060 [Arcobacter sp.]